MKKLIFLLLIFSVAQAQVKISDMPVYIPVNSASLSGSFVPILQGSVNKKVDAKYFEGVDTLYTNATKDTLISVKNGVTTKFAILRSVQPYPRG